MLQVGFEPTRLSALGLKASSLTTRTLQRVLFFCFKYHEISMSNVIVYFFYPPKKHLIMLREGIEPSTRLPHESLSLTPLPLGHLS